MCNECFLYSWAGSYLELFFQELFAGYIYFKRLRSALWHHLPGDLAENLVLGDAGIVDKINLKTIRLVNNNEELEALIKRKRILSTNHRTGF